MEMYFYVLSQALPKRRQENNSSPFPLFSKAPGSMALLLLCAYLSQWEYTPGVIFAITGCAQLYARNEIVCSCTHNFCVFWAPIQLLIVGTHTFQLHPTLLEFLPTCAIHIYCMSFTKFITGESGLVFRGYLAGGKLVAVKTVKGDQ